MKALITGATGFIGSNLVNYLDSRRLKIMAVDDFSTGKTENTKDFPNSVEVCDITNYRDLEVIFNKFRPDTVFHLAAQPAITTSFKDPKHDLLVNAMGTLNLIELAKKYNTKKFVFSSTSAVYGRAGNRWFPSKETDRMNPDTPYGISKATAEYYIRTLFDNHVILRYANVYGPRQIPVGENQLIARAFSHFLGNDFEVVGDGNQKRDFVYVEDVCHANYFFSLENVTGTFNICTGKSVSVNHILSLIEKEIEIVGYPWEHSRDRDLRGDVHLSPSLANKNGWSAYTPLELGIQIVSAWWKDKQ